MPRCPWSSFIFLFQPVQGWEYNAEKYREAIIKEELCKVPVNSDWGLYPLGIGGFPTNKKLSLEQMRKEYHEYCPKSKSNNIVYCPDQIIKRKKDKKLQWINDFFKNIEKKKKKKRLTFFFLLHKKKEKNPKSNTNEKVEEIKGKVNNIKDILNNKLDYININIKHDINDKLDIIETLSDKVAEIK